MKFAIVAILLLAGAISTQYAANVDSCVADVRLSVFLVEKLVEDVKENNHAKVIQDIMKAVPLLNKLKAECNGLGIKDIVSYVYAHLTQAQRDCLTEVLGVVFNAQSVIEDVKSKNWSELNTDLKMVVGSLEGVKEKCDASLLAQFNF